MKGKIKLLEGSPFGVFILTYEGELYISLRLKTDDFFYKILSSQLTAKILDISCGNTTGSNVILDADGRVQSFIFPQSKFAPPPTNVNSYSIPLESINLGEKAIQICALYENCMAIGVSGNLYTWGRYIFFQKMFSFFFIFFQKEWLWSKWNWS